MDDSLADEQEVLANDAGDEPERVLSAEIADATHLLDAMFAPSGVASLKVSAPDHPAVRQFEALEALRSSGRVDRRRETELLSELADYFLDFRIWPRSPDEADFWAFLDDAAGRERVRRNIRDAHRYEDTLAEVDTWAALREEGLPVTLLEEESLPDLRIGETDAAIWGEVKAVQLGTAPRNVGNAVTKANRQLREAQPDRSGILFIRLSRATHRASLDDRIPDDVAPYIDEIRREISGSHNRSVGLAVASWTDFFIFDDGHGRALHAFRRRSLVLQHIAPHSVPGVDLATLDFGRTFAISVHYPELPAGVDVPTFPSIAAGPIVVTPLFRDMNEFTYGIRPQHAIEAMSAPDVVEHMGPVILALRRVPVAGYSLLLIASERDGETQIMMGFRLYDGAATTSLSPIAALNRMLTACGVPTNLGGHVALLHPEATVDEFRIETVGPSSEKGSIHAAVRRRDDGRFDVSCAFAIDSERYERTLAPPP